MKVLMKYSRPNSCANPSLIARQERAGTEILLLGGVWNYSTILGSSSLGSRERGSIFAWYQVSPSKTLRDPPPPPLPTRPPPSIHNHGSQPRCRESFVPVMNVPPLPFILTPNASTLPFIRTPHNFSRKIWDYLDVLGLGIFCHLEFSKNNPWIYGSRGYSTSSP